MVRLSRKNIKVFAGSATNNGVFGSLQANNPTTSSDVEQIQSLPAWSEGWNSATETSELLPPLEEFQGVQYVTTYQQAYIMQEGIPEWSATVTYYKGSLTKKVTSTGFQIYNSLTDNNTGNLLNDTDNWKLIMDSDNLYAFDNNVVHLTGDETIAGVKTFSSSPVIPNGLSSNDAVNKSQLDTLNTTLQNLITTSISNTLASLYPVGSIYIGTQSSCPLATLISGSTWELVAQNRALWGTDNVNNANTTIAAGLPNIEGYVSLGGYVKVDGLRGAFWDPGTRDAGAIGSTGTGYLDDFNFAASKWNSIYGSSNTVQPPAYRVNVWRRTA